VQRIVERGVAPEDPPVLANPLPVAPHDDPVGVGAHLHRLAGRRHAVAVAIEADQFDALTS
jgi:hypothetical protein